MNVTAILVKAPPSHPFSANKPHELQLLPTHDHNHEDELRTAEVPIMAATLVAASIGLLGGFLASSFGSSAYSYVQLESVASFLESISSAPQLMGMKGIPLDKSRPTSDIVKVITVIYKPTRTNKTAGNHVSPLVAPSVGSDTDYTNIFNGWTTEILFVMFSLILALGFIAMVLFCLRGAHLTDIALLKSQIQRRIQAALQNAKYARAYAYRSAQASKDRFDIATAWIVVARKIVHANKRLHKDLDSMQISYNAMQTSYNAMQTSYDAMQTSYGAMRNKDRKQRRKTRYAIKRVQNSLLKATERADMSEQSKRLNAVEAAGARLSVAALEGRSVIQSSDLLNVLQREDKARGRIESSLSNANNQVRAAEQRISSTKATADAATKRVEGATYHIKALLCIIYILRLSVSTASNKQKRSCAAILVLETQLSEYRTQYNALDILYRDAIDGQRVVTCLLAQFKIQNRRFDIPARIAHLANRRIHLVEKRDMLRKDLDCSNQLKQGYEKELATQKLVNQSLSDDFSSQISELQSNFYGLAVEHDSLKLDYAALSARKLCVCRRILWTTSHNSNNHDSGNDDQSGGGKGMTDKHNRHDDARSSDGDSHQKDDNYDTTPDAPHDGQSRGLSDSICVPKEVTHSTPTTGSIKLAHPIPNAESGAHVAPPAATKSLNWESLLPYWLRSRPPSPPSNRSSDSFKGTRYRQIREWHQYRVSSTASKDPNKPDIILTTDEGKAIAVLPWVESAPTALPAWTPTGPRAQRKFRNLPAKTPKGPSKWAAKGQAYGGNGDHRRLMDSPRYRPATKMLNPSAPTFNTTARPPIMMPQATEFTPGRPFHDGGGEH